jgi:nitroreductase
VVLVEDKKNRDGLLDLAPGSKNWAKQAPHLLALVADYINFENDYDHGLALIDTSLFSSFLQLAFVSHGVGSCCLNWPDLDRLHRPAKNLLNLSSTETVVMLLAFGYPSEDGLVPRSLKKSCEDVLTLLE